MQDGHTSQKQAIIEKQRISYVYFRCLRSYRVIWSGEREKDLSIGSLPIKSEGWNV